MDIYQLSYDRDWGSRGNRRNVVWYLGEKLPKKDTLKFIKTALGKDEINECAYTWTKITLGKRYAVTLGHD